MILQEQLQRLAGQLLELQPMAARYRELENLTIGTMLTLRVDEVAVAGKGKLVLDERVLKLTVWPVGMQPECAARDG